MSYDDGLYETMRGMEDVLEGENEVALGAAIGGSVGRALVADGLRREQIGQFEEGVGLVEEAVEDLFGI
jgi:hypothetical protein